MPDAWCVLALMRPSMTMCNSVTDVACVWCVILIDDEASDYSAVVISWDFLDDADICSEVVCVVEYSC